MQSLESLIALWPDRAEFVAELAQTTGAPRASVRKWLAHDRAPPAKFAVEIAAAARRRGGDAWTVEAVIAAIRRKQGDKGRVQNVTA